jgi:hypothetical protein
VAVVVAMAVVVSFPPDFEIPWKTIQKSYIQ